MLVIFLIVKNTLKHSKYIQVWEWLTMKHLFKERGLKTLLYTLLMLKMKELKAVMLAGLSSSLKVCFCKYLCLSWALWFILCSHWQLTAILPRSWHNLQSSNWHLLERYRALKLSRETPLSEGISQGSSLHQHELILPLGHGGWLDSLSSIPEDQGRGMEDWGAKRSLPEGLLCFFNCHIICRVVLPCPHEPPTEWC